MTQNKKQIDQYAGVSLSDVACIVEPLFVAQCGHIIAIAEKMTTPSAQFMVMHLFDQVKLAGVGVVESKYKQILEDIAADPRPRTTVGEHQMLSVVDMHPILSGLMLMFAQGELTPQSRSDQMHVFEVKITEQQ